MPPRAGRVVIVTPSLADANNGNWRTSERWRRFLAPRRPARLATAWPDAQAAADSVMIALHARRSAAAIAAWHARHGGARLAVVLTGTDLYRDIAADAAAQRSLELAGTLVVLQERGPLALPAALRGKARVIFQSAVACRTPPKAQRHLRAVMVGHLREEKSPETLFAAARLLADRDDILIDHIGGALDAELGREAAATMAACRRYRWLGNLAHAETLRRIRQAHLLVHCSRMEGGAHVIAEALASGTPAIASRIDGNVGMLGEDYAGYFPWGDANELARLLAACRDAQGEPDGLLARLGAQARARSRLFAPEAERAAVQQLLDGLAA